MAPTLVEGGEDREDVFPVGAGQKNAPRLCRESKWL